MIETVRQHHLENLASAINSAAPKIEEEYNNTDRTWMQCAGTVLFTIELELGIVSKQGVLPTAEIELARERIALLKTKLARLEKEYRVREMAVPQALKQEVLDDLNILK